MPPNQVCAYLAKRTILISDHDNFQNVNGILENPYCYAQISGDMFARTMLATAQTPQKSLPPREASVPVPMLGEEQSQFFDRAMRALSKSIPSVNRRTVEVLKLWCASNNDQDLRDKAFMQFQDDKFVHYEPRCVFLEHTVPASADGSRGQIVYDRTALQHLVNWANYRIRNSDNFAAISDGHTPTADEKQSGQSMPEVLGYSGPFYLGLLGDVDPKWAVYADEWVHNEDVSRFDKLQRRSPEVWVNEPIEQRTMDPIAALGAETPRLDSGMNPYCRRAGDGQDVYREIAQSETIMRYSMASAALPGPSNTFIPGSGRKPKQRYGETAMPKPMQRYGETAENEEGRPSIGDAVARALEAVMPSIIQAVEEELNGESEGTEEQPGIEEEPGELSPVPEASNGNSPTNPATVPREAPEESGTEEPVAEPRKPPGDDEDARYKSQGPAIYGAYCAGKKSAMNYSRTPVADPSMHKRLAQLEVDNRKLKQDIANERQDAMRYAKLNELSREYAFNPNEEMETVIEMTDAQFDRHCNVTVQRYQRRDDITNLQIFDDPTVEVDQYRRGQQSGEPTVEECYRYSMLAADIAAKKNFEAKKQVTDAAAEYDALMAKHGQRSAS